MWEMPSAFATTTAAKPPCRSQAALASTACLFSALRDAGAEPASLLPPVTNCQDLMEVDDTGVRDPPSSDRLPEQDRPERAVQKGQTRRECVSSLGIRCSGDIFRVAGWAGCSIPPTRRRRDTKSIPRSIAPVRKRPRTRRRTCLGSCSSPESCRARKMAGQTSHAGIPRASAGPPPVCIRP